MLTDSQRTALAALSIGETHTLVDRVDLPDGAKCVKYHGSFWVTCGGFDGAHFLDPPHGKPGDVIEGDIIDFIPPWGSMDTVEQIEPLYLIQSVDVKNVYPENGSMLPPKPIPSWLTTVERTNEQANRPTNERGRGAYASVDLPRRGSRRTVVRVCSQ